MSKAGKLVVYVQHTRNGEVISVRTKGVVASTPVNAINNDAGYGSRSTAPDSVTYWTAVLARVVANHLHL